MSHSETPYLRIFSGTVFSSPLTHQCLPVLSFYTGLTPPLYSSRGGVRYPYPYPYPYPSTISIPIPIPILIPILQYHTIPCYHTMLPYHATIPCYHTHTHTHTYTTIPCYHIHTHTYQVYTLVASSRCRY